MKTKIQKAPCSVLGICLCLSVLSLVGCSGDSDNIPAPYAGDEYHLTAPSIEESVNELNRRLLRYDEYAIGDATIPEPSYNSFNMGWQVKSLVWQNVTEETFGVDKVTPIYNGFLKSKTQDDYGYIYNQNDFREEPKWAGEASWGTVAGGPQGWTFPTWKEAVEDPFALNGVSDRFFTSYDFNSSNDDTNKNWETNAGSFDVDGSGYAKFASNVGVGESFRFYNECLSDVLSRYGGIVGSQAAFVEVDMDFASKNLSGINLIWKTEEGGERWFSASYSDYVTLPQTDFSRYGGRSYWPMYLNDDWNGKTITAIGLEFVPETGKKLSLTDGKINYLRPSYDTRQPQFAFQWFESFYNYACYTRDFDALKELMPKARRTMLFFLHCLQGEKGSLSLDFFHGHNGIGTTINDDGSVTTHPGEGIASGYWDTLALPTMNLESNAYFYTCIKEMAALEEVCETQGFVVESVSIKNREIGGERVTYTYNSSSLRLLENKVKETIEKDIRPVLKDGKYVNDGGLWNRKTGRFALGVREDNGEIIDHGYVLFNEQAIVAGLGKAEQRRSVMEWIDGSREVEGDLSKGKDIYFYEFAPRFSTKDCFSQFNFSLAKLNFGEESAWKTYGSLFSRQVQDGGAVLWASYYDLVARAQVLGGDNAYSRLEGIVSWYDKVKRETEGEGTAFFENYYYNVEMYGDNAGEGYFVRQAANVEGAGAIGLDSEFLENSIFVRAIPDAFFGMETSSLDLISFTHNIPSGVSYLRGDNLRFGKAAYALLETKDGMEITSIRGAVHQDTKIEFAFKQPSGAFKVYVNDQETSDYVVTNGTVKVKVPFSKVKVSIK